MIFFNCLTPCKAIMSLLLKCKGGWCAVKQKENKQTKTQGVIKSGRKCERH